MGNLGFPEIMLLMIFGLIVFGPQRLPEIARQVGKAIGELRRMSASVTEEVRQAIELSEPERSHDFPYMAGPKDDSETPSTKPGYPDPGPADPDAPQGP